MICLFFAAGVSGFVFTKLVRMTGNADPRQTYIGTAIAGILTFVFLYTLLKYMFHFA